MQCVSDHGLVHPVIFLNGASSAGKTSLGRALQDALPEPYLLLGLDTCFGMVPLRWSSTGDRREAGFSYMDLPAEDGHPVLGIAYGPAGRAMLTAFQQAVAALVTAGSRVVVDEMLLGPEIRDRWRTVLDPFRPFYVGVRCGVDELERRERTRTARPGLARWSARQAHVGMAYALEIDTTEATPEQCAEQVCAALS
jgi:chloramphenicol 3-O phosphotransferase